MKIINKVANQLAIKIFLSGAGIFYLIFAFSYWDLSPMAWSVLARLFLGFILLIFGFVLAILTYYVKKEVRKDARVIEAEKIAKKARESFVNMIKSLDEENKVSPEQESLWKRRLKEVQEAKKKAEGKMND